MAYRPTKREERIERVAHLWVATYGNKYRLDRFLRLESYNADHYRAKQFLVGKLNRFLEDHGIKPLAANVYTFLASIDSTLTL